VNSFTVATNVSMMPMNVRMVPQYPISLNASIDLSTTDNTTSSNQDACLCSEDEDGRSQFVWFFSPQGREHRNSPIAATDSDNGSKPIFIDAHLSLVTLNS
jgi:hypothetical protein